MEGRTWVYLARFAGRKNENRRWKKKFHFPESRNLAGKALFYLVFTQRKMATKCKELKTAKWRTANSKLQTFIIPNKRLWPCKSTACCNGPKKHESGLVTERCRVVRSWVFVILFLILLNLSLVSVLLDHSGDDTVWKSKRDYWDLVVINSDSMFILIAAKWEKILQSWQRTTLTSNDLDNPLVFRPNGCL